MKILLFSFSAFCIISISACNGSNKTGGATRDSSVSHGYSGPSDSAGVAGSSAIGTTSMGSDTSKTGKSTVNPTVDSGKVKP